MTQPKLQPITGGKSRKRGKTIFERARIAKANLDEATAAMESIKQELRLAFPEGKYDDEGVLVTIAPNVQLNKTLAAKLYPADEFKELTYTAASLKSKLTGDQYKALQTPSENGAKVTVELKMVTG